MARSVPADRFDELLRVAQETFIANGYARTQMEDVAKALGVGKGTVYCYVESKQALFDFVVRNTGRGHVPGRLARALACGVEPGEAIGPGVVPGGAGGPAGGGHRRDRATGCGLAERPGDETGASRAGGLSMHPAQPVAGKGLQVIQR